MILPGLVDDEDDTEIVRMTRYYLEKNRLRSYFLESLVDGKVELQERCENECQIKTSSE